ncbi:MAG: hypothetical protein VYA34_01555 [Myxococcota bacterium]|nr:hypothetical protein [Myxococcota bacterium]
MLKRSLLALFGIVLLSGCEALFPEPSTTHDLVQAGVDEGLTEEAIPAGAQGNVAAVFDPVNVDIPYPNNLLFAAGGSGPTDGTMNIPMGGECTDPADLPEGVTKADENYSDPFFVLNTLDGFSTLQPMIFRFNGSVDPDTVVAGETVRVFEVELANYLLDAKAVRAELAAPNALLGVLGDYTVEVVTDSSSTKDDTGEVIGRTYYDFVKIVPTKPLKPDTAYLVAVTTGITDLGGHPVGSATLYKLAKSKASFFDSEGNLKSDLPTSGEQSFGLANEKNRDSYGSLETIRSLTNTYEQVLAPYIPSDDIVLSWAWTTQSTDNMLKTIVKNVKAGRYALGPALHPADTSKVSTTRDLCPEVATDATCKVIADATACGANPLCTHTPATGCIASGCISYNLLGLSEIYLGAVELPYFLKTGNKSRTSFWEGHLGQYATRFYSAGSGGLGPKMYGSEVVPLVVSIPSAVLGCSKPYKTAIFAHEVLTDRTTMAIIADSFAKECMAMAAIDLPLHGINKYEGPATSNDPAKGLSPYYFVSADFPTPQAYKALHGNTCGVLDAADCHANRVCEFDNANDVCGVSSIIYAFNGACVSYSNETACTGGQSCSWDGFTCSAAPIAGAYSNLPWYSTVLGPLRERHFNLDFADNSAALAVASPNYPTGDGKVDPSGFDFINPNKLLTTRDNVRQAVSDFLVLAETIPEITDNSEGMRHLLRIGAKFPHIVGGLAGGDTSYSMRMNLGEALPGLFSDPSAAPELEIPQDEGVCSADPATYCRMKDPTNPLLGAQCPRKELDDRTCSALGTEDKVMVTKSIRAAVEMVDQFFAIKNSLGSAQAELGLAIADAQTAIKLYVATGAFFADNVSASSTSTWEKTGCMDNGLSQTEQIAKVGVFAKALMAEDHAQFGFEADEINVLFGEGGMWEPVLGQATSSDAVVEVGVSTRMLKAQEIVVEKVNAVMKVIAKIAGDDVDQDGVITTAEGGVLANTAAAVQVVTALVQKLYTTDAEGNKSGYALTMKGAVDYTVGVVADLCEGIDSNESCKNPHLSSEIQAELGAIYKSVAAQQALVDGKLAALAGFSALVNAGNTFLTGLDLPNKAFAWHQSTHYTEAKAAWEKNFSSGLYNIPESTNALSLASFVDGGCLESNAGALGAHLFRVAEQDFNKAGSFASVVGAATVGNGSDSASYDGPVAGLSKMAAVLINADALTAPGGALGLLENINYPGGSCESLSDTSPWYCAEAADPMGLTQATVAAYDADLTVAAIRAQAGEQLDNMTLGGAMFGSIVVGVGDISKALLPSCLGVGAGSPCLEEGVKFTDLDTFPGVAYAGGNVVALLGAAQGAGLFRRLAFQWEGEPLFDPNHVTMVGLGMGATVVSIAASMDDWRRTWDPGADDRIKAVTAIAPFTGFAYQFEGSGLGGSVKTLLKTQTSTAKDEAGMCHKSSSPITSDKERGGVMSYEQFWAVFQAAMDPADPINYVSHLTDTKFLMVDVENDPTAPTNVARRDYGATDPTQPDRVLAGSEALAKQLGLSRYDAAVSSLGAFHAIRLSNSSGEVDHAAFLLPDRGCPDKADDAAAYYACASRVGTKMNTLREAVVKFLADGNGNLTVADPSILKDVFLD